MPFWFIRISRMIEVYHPCQCANICYLFNLSTYSGPYCFRPHIIPLAILVDRLVIFGRYCMIRLLQFNVISICLALNRLNKFINIYYQFSRIDAAQFPSRRWYYRKCWNWSSVGGKCRVALGGGVPLSPQKYRPTPYRSLFSPLSHPTIAAFGWFHPVPARQNVWTIKL